MVKEGPLLCPLWCPPVPGMVPGAQETLCKSLWHELSWASRVSRKLPGGMPFPAGEELEQGPAGVQGLGVFGEQPAACGRRSWGCPAEGMCTVGSHICGSHVL